MKILKKAFIVLIISVIPAIDGVADDKQSPQEKPKTKTVCKMVLPKPQPGPWTVLNQIHVKVCKEVPVANTGK